MTDHITFFESYFEAVEDLDPETYKECLNALFAYVFRGEEPQDLSPSAKMFWKLTRPNIDTSLRRSASGKQGGSVGKQTETKQEAKPKQEETKSEADAKQDESTDKANCKQTVSKVEANPKQTSSDKDKEIGERNKEIEDKEKESEGKPPRHRFGEYKHVLLTDVEYQRLVSEFGKGIADKAIKAVDEYCQQTGKSYKDYNLTIRKWGIRTARGEQTARSGTTGRSPTFNHIEQHDYDFEALEKMLGG